MARGWNYVIFMVASNPSHPMILRLHCNMDRLRNGAKQSSSSAYVQAGHHGTQHTTPSKGKKVHLEIRADTYPGRGRQIAVWVEISLSC